MTNILEILKNRRVWVAIIGVIMFVGTVFDFNVDIDQNFLADRLVEFGTAIGSLVAAGLALYSYLKPKKV